MVWMEEAFHKEVKRALQCLAVRLPMWNNDKEAKKPGTSSQMTEGWWREDFTGFLYGCQSTKQKERKAKSKQKDEKE